MTEGPQRDYAERIAEHDDSAQTAWNRTIEEMDSMATELTERGWSVVTAAAGHTAPEPDDVGEDDRFGFVYVVSDNDAADIDALVDGGFEPVQTEVYNQEFGQRLFLLTKLVDRASERVLLLAGNCELRHVSGLAKTAAERGALFTHVQRLDTTPVASFRHESYEEFFPNFYRYVDE